MIEPYEKKDLETMEGTPYEVWKWICPQCKNEKSTLYIDGEIVHGDGQVSVGSKDGWDEFCFDCWAAKQSSS